MNVGNCQVGHKMLSNLCAHSKLNVKRSRTKRSEVEMHCTTHQVGTLLCLLFMEIHPLKRLIITIIAKHFIAEQHKC